MDERILKWLYDIRDAIIEIDGYFDGIPKDFKQYSSNTLLKRAVERDLEIIGEAVNRIIRKEPDFPIESANRIVGYGIKLSTLTTTSLMRIFGR